MIYCSATSNGLLETGRINTIKTGYAAGAGIEAPLTERLSVKAEYLYVKFSGATVESGLLAPFNQPFTHSADLAVNIARIGRNYRWGGDVSPATAAVIPIKAPRLPALEPVGSSWVIETGARLWFSTGEACRGPHFPSSAFWRTWSQEFLDLFLASTYSCLPFPSKAALGSVYCWARMNAFHRSRAISLRMRNDSFWIKSWRMKRYPDSVLCAALCGRARTAGGNGWPERY